MSFTHEWYLGFIPKMWRRESSLPSIWNMSIWLPVVNYSLTRNRKSICVLMDTVSGITKHFSSLEKLINSKFGFRKKKCRRRRPYVSSDVPRLLIIQKTCTRQRKNQTNTQTLFSVWWKDVSECCFRLLNILTQLNQATCTKKLRRIFMTVL